MKFIVELCETLKYELEVEADSAEQAEDKAFEHRRFTSSDADSTDTSVMDVYEAPSGYKCYQSAYDFLPYMVTTLEGQAVAQFADRESAEAFIAREDEKS